MTDDRKVSRNWRTVAIVAVLASVVLIWKTSVFLTDHTQVDHENFAEARNHAIALNEAIANEERKNAALRHDLDSITRKAAAEQGALKSDLRGYKTRYKLRRDTVTVTLADTIIIVQDSLIVSLEIEKAQLVDKFTGIVDAAQEKARLSGELATMWEAAAVDQSKARTEDAKRWRRQRTKERIIEVAIVVGVVILAL